MLSHSRHLALRGDGTMQSKSDIDALIDGFASFKQEYLARHQGQQKLKMQNLSTPRVMVVGCCDSRFDPAIITNSDAGDIFVVRNVANLIPPCQPDKHYQETPAALEYGVCYLDVEELIVMGHGRCNGLRTLLHRLIDGSLASHPLAEWTEIAEQAAEQVLRAGFRSDLDWQVDQLSRKALSLSLNNLERYPFIAARLNEGTLRLRGWYFDPDSAALEELDRASGQFRWLC